MLRRPRGSPPGEHALVDSDRKEFGTIMASVYDFWNRELSDVALEIWWESLRNFSFDAVRGALARHMRNPDTGQFMPKIADVVKFLEGNTLTQAMRAWQKVNEAIKRVGTYASVVFDDPIIHAVIADMGGWQPLGMVQDEEWPFKAREFEKRYQSYKVRPPQTYPRKLIGIFEVENAKNGYAVGEPVMLGNPDQAKLVYQGGAERIGIAASVLKLIPERLAS